jgi:tRNA modification GTPase
LRLSGPAALDILRAGFRPLPATLESHKMVHGWWHDARGEPLDEGLAVVMYGPHSYTGEDVVELHLHGGALGLDRALEACIALGAQRAEPGEFTRRAFLNGRMDLTRAEAVADLIGARTERALDASRALLRGRLYDLAIDARESILGLRAELEVNIDFVEEDVPLVDPAGLAARARTLAAELSELAQTYGRGRLLRQGARAVLTGAPNAGKSSLFNALLGAERAIVTEIPGTTRDTVEEALDIGGIPVVLVDTAGLRDALDPVEAAGIARTQSALESADLVVHLEDGSTHGLAVTRPDGPPTVLVCSKSDLPAARTVPGALRVSATTGEGLDALRQSMAHALGAHEVGEGNLVIVHQRHRDALVEAAEGLERAASALDRAEPPELVAVEVAEATDALARLVGLTTLEDVLDRLFGSFCIGK